METDAFASFAGRIVRAHGRRVAEGDVEALSDLAALAVLVDEQTTIAVRRLRSAEGGAYSWADIGRVLGTSRQAAQQRFGDDGRGVRRVGGQPGWLR